MDNDHPPLHPPASANACAGMGGAFLNDIAFAICQIVSFDQDQDMEDGTPEMSSACFSSMSFFPFSMGKYFLKGHILIHYFIKLDT